MGGGFLKRLKPLSKGDRDNLNSIRKHVSKERAKLINDLLKDEKIGIENQLIESSLVDSLSFPQIIAKTKKVDTTDINKELREIYMKKALEDFSKKAFDVIPEISLHGGEPFLHPEIKEICREAAAIPNIVFVSFVTNGTIMLTDDTLHLLSICGADVNQSGGYGSLSRKQDVLFEAFRRHNIYSDILFCSQSEMWIQTDPIKKHNRSDAENNEQYKNSGLWIF